MRSSIGRFICSAAAAAALICAPEAASAQAGFAGRWTLDAEASTPMSEIVRSGMSKLGRVYRVWPISSQAKRRLQDTNKPSSFIRIEPSGEDLVVETDRYTLRTPKNGLREDWERSPGDVIDVATQWGPAQFTQNFVADDGQRLNAYTLGPGGDTLYLDVTVTSPKLDSPLQYRIVYRRDQ